MDLSRRMSLGGSSGDSAIPAIFDIFGLADVNSGPVWDPKRAPQGPILNDLGDTKYSLNFGVKISMFFFLTENTENVKNDKVALDT